MIYADIFRITLWQDLRQNAYYYGTVTHISQAGQQGDKMRYKAEAVYSLNRSNAIAAEYCYEQNYGKDLDEALVSWRYYF